jgi:hypothetical protein
MHTELMWQKELTMLKLQLVLAYASIFLLCSCQRQNNLESRNEATVKSDVEARNIATLHRYWKELLNENDISKAHEIIATDFTLYVNREPVEPRGSDIFKQMGESDRRMSDNQFFEDEIVAAGNTIASRWHGTAIHDKETSGYKPLPNGQKITWEGMCFYHFDENGLMTDGYLVTNLWEKFEKRERAAKQVDHN